MAKSLLEVAQTIALISSPCPSAAGPGRGDAVHPARRRTGMAHVMLAGVNEAMLPFRPDDEAAAPPANAGRHARNCRKSAA